jgi:esterase/lipase
VIPPLAELDTWLAQREARVPALRPGCEKRVIWADGPRRTPWTVIYVHGFSASRREASPWPERVAQELGANYFGARLTGHGQDGPALDRATLRDWRADTAEALAIGRAIGERLLVLSCSTGSTLVTLALADGEVAAGTAMLSPHYGLRMRRLQAALDAPLASVWMPLLVRAPQGPPAANVDSGIWTAGYTTRAYDPMARAVRAARRADLGQVQTPALFAFSDADAVVDPGLTAAVMRRWGGPARHLALTPGPGDDPMAHVLAGDALSPGQTDGAVQATLDWARNL